MIDGFESLSMRLFTIECAISCLKGIMSLRCRIYRVDSSTEVYYFDSRFEGYASIFDRKIRCIPALT